MLALFRGVRVGTVLPAPVPERRLQRPPKPVSAQIAAGRLLLHRRGCTGCHDLDLPTYPHPRGPDLGSIGRKTRAASPESHPYVLSARDATDLSAFLVRRFTPPGGPDQSVMADTLDAGARVLLAQARGEISDSPYILFARQIRVTHQK